MSEPDGIRDDGALALVTSDLDELRDRWRVLDAAIRTWWSLDVHTATDDDVRADPEGTLLPLPYPYVSAGGSEADFPEMFGWDTHFINTALLAHGEVDQVERHVRNHIAMIERYGMVLNGNRTYYLSRSQPPLLAESARRLLEQRFDPGLARLVARWCAHEYETYWCADHHTTPVGLATNRDLGGSRERIELASESETGLDFTPQFGGDVRRCTPLITNSCLVRAAGALAWVNRQLGDEQEAERWEAERVRRATLIDELCWDEEAGLYREYDFVAGTQVPVATVSSLWPLWAGVSDTDRAARVVAGLGRFRHPFGLTSTDRPYPSPHPEFHHLQWEFPAGWPPEQLMVGEALRQYGFEREARELAVSWLRLQVGAWERTGKLWEKYNVVDGTLELPVERYPSVGLHGWSSAAAVVLGRTAFGGP